MKKMRNLVPMQTRQHGVVLVVAMIIMTMVALMSLSALRASDSNVQVASNVQSRQEGLESAQVALERVISANTFHQDPAAVKAAAPLSVDVNGDQREDFAVSMQQPECLRGRRVTGQELDDKNPRDAACMAGGEAQDTGNADGFMTNENCRQTEWQLTAMAQSPVAGTDVTVSQGVALRMQTADAINRCS